jgi:hypothetical protein
MTNASRDSGYIAWSSSVHEVYFLVSMDGVKIDDTVFLSKLSRVNLAGTPYEV